MHFLLTKNLDYIKKVIMVYSNKIIKEVWNVLSMFRIFYRIMSTPMYIKSIRILRGLINQLTFLYSNKTITTGLIG